MDIEKISSSGPSNRDCDRTAEASSPPQQLSSAPGLQNLRGAATAVGDMEAAVPSRVALSTASRLPNRHAVAGDRSFIYKGRCQSLAIPMALSAAAPGKGGVLDRPVEKTTPGRQSEFDVK
ncbi:ATP-dependent Clp protease adapter protein CLPS1, chloroplastic-like [Miscanthus floridulus]|uniref:ATP-dependent Clp protease adapter protein CLPS1, chloroplastic-like n=1 Tax=Miscanthus floridulus TaxID=154761 RepID=UPI003459CD22